MSITNRYKTLVEANKKTDKTDTSFKIIRDNISTQLANYEKELAIILLKRIINYCKFLLQLAK